MNQVRIEHISINELKNYEMGILFDKIIFGPLRSRRLGLSLGVNLLSVGSKHCNFDCIYCECGWNGDHPNGSFNTLSSVVSRLEAKLIEMRDSGELPDTITFAGNGEPTMHPEFGKVIDITLLLRDKYAPNAKVSVLSNATMIDREGVVEALKKVDMNILKLDSAILKTQEVVNQANIQRPIAEQIELLKQFSGQTTIQTMFLRGLYAGVEVDNTSNEEVDALLKAYKEIMPKSVMLYSLDRETPASGLKKVSKEDMEIIGERVKELGIDVSIA